MHKPRNCPEGTFCMFKNFLAAKLLIEMPITAAEWAQSTLQKMTLDEKIGQLMMAGAYSCQEEANTEGQTEPHQEYVENLIRKYHIGSIIFKRKWEPSHQLSTVNHYQDLSKTPLLIAQDCEWGLTMRMPSALRFPRNMTLGAIEDDELIYRMGLEIGRQCRLVGVNFALSPVVDVNNNPSNPVINDRSFGENPEKVAKKGESMMRGLQDAGVIACAKHFPGHGDTSVDSHLDLPVMDHSRERLDQIELVPFRHLIQAGVKSLMTAHLYLPQIDPTSLLPASLNPKIVNEILLNELNFTGLVISDDLLMRAISDRYGPGPAALKAFQAGNHLIISSKDIAEGVACIKQAIQEGSVSMKELDARVLKILEMKEWVQEQNSSKTSLENISLHTPEAVALKRRLYQEVITLVADPMQAIPIKGQSIALIESGTDQPSQFAAALTAEHQMPVYHLSEGPQKLAELKTYDQVIVSLFGMNKYLSQDFGISAEARELIDLLGEKGIVVIFGSPYSLVFFDRSKQALVEAYEDDEDAQNAAAAVILGKIAPKGILPVR